MIGAIIKKQRLAKNLSQESLCRGICSVSYLSKIETGRTDASQEILTLLLQRLDVPVPESPEDIHLYRKMIRTGIDGVIFGDREQVKSINEQLRAEDSMLSNSPLAIDWLLFQCYIAMSEYKPEGAAEILKTIESLMSNITHSQQHHYYLIKGMNEVFHHRFHKALDYFQQALTFERNGHVLSHIAIAYFYTGDYVSTISLGKEAYQMLMEEGNLHRGIQLSNAMAASYSNKGQIQESIRVYERILRLTENRPSAHTLYSVYYSMGATYLVQGDYGLALENLTLALSLAEEVGHWNQMNLYQKFVLCYVKLEDFDSAHRYLDRMEELKSGLDSQDTSSLLLSLNWLLHYRSKNHPEADKDYLESLQRTFEASKKDSPFGFQLFYGKYLIEAFKRHRKYKEALSVSEYL